MEFSPGRMRLVFRRITWRTKPNHEKWDLNQPINMRNFGNSSCFIMFFFYMGLNQNTMTLPSILIFMLKS